jgi:RHS repeat-associated protein
MHNGDLHVEKPVLALGATPPLGVQLGISYSSMETARESLLGRGWRHSLDARIHSGSDGATMFGARRAADATPLIVAARVVTDLLDENAGAAEWTVAALAAKWAIDQTMDNSVIARTGDTALTYVRMPDGAYNPPPGVTAELIRTNGQYRLVERFGTEFRFDATGRAESLVDVHGRTTQFAYNAQTDLQSVTDAYGRELTFSYSAGRLVQVSDNTGRHVAFDYSGDDLVRFTDAEGGEWEYRYDDAHRIIALIDPLGQTTASNVYNQVGQVVTQYNGYAEAWSFHCADYVGTEVDPAGNALTHRFDHDGRNLGTEDALGRRTLKRFDAQGRLTEHRDANNHSTRFFYDAHNNLTNRTDALGNAWTFEYDAEHRLVAESDPLGHTTRYFHNAAHQVTNIVDALANSVATAYYTSGAAQGLPRIVTDARGLTTEYTYNAYGLPATVARADGGTVSHQWNARGDLLATWDANGNPTVMTYDNRRNLTSATDALGHTVSNIYNAAGLKTAVIDPLGRQTVTAWTPSYQVASVTHADGSVVANMYDNRDLLVATVDPRGGVHSNLYDRAQRKIAEIDPLGNRTSYALDPNGNILGVTNALGHVVHTVYDALNRATNNWEILPGGTRSVASEFDAAGRLVSATDANGFTTAYEYDALNRRTAVLKPDGTVERFEHDPSGNLLVFQNALGHPRAFAYDGMNRVTNEVNAIGRQRQYQYDFAGNLLVRTDASGASVTNSYDSLHRLVAIAYPDGQTVAYEYNALGLRTAQSNSVAQVQYGYDQMNRLSAVTSSVFSVSSVVNYAYDSSGNRTNVVYPGGLNVGYAYDLANRLTHVTDWAERQTSYGYDALHRQTGTAYPNAAAATFAWDAASRLTGLQHHNGASNFVDRAYTLDPLGNISAMTVNAGLLPHITPQMTRLQQNPADELTAIQTKANPGVQDWNNTTPTHDLEGNLLVAPEPSGEGGTSDGTQTYTYDYENRLVLCDSASLRETFFYSADGSRVAAETVSGGSTNLTIFVLDHGGPLRRPLAEMDTQAGSMRYYVWGNGLVAQIEADDGAVRYFHADGQGSTLALTDASAAVTDQWFHDPYGETLNRAGSTATPYQWIGGHGVRAEASGLHFMRHRYYHAGLKRFVSQDPIGLAGGVNLYAYALGSPLVFYDPYGLCANSFAKRSWNAIKGVAIIGAGFVPYLGDAMDVYDVAAPGSSAFERTVGGISLGVNAWTAGLAPNAGPIMRGAGMVADAFRGVSRGGRRAAGEVGQAVVRGSRETVQRAMSRAELDSILDSGVISRGGRAGPHYVSDAVSTDALRARQRLALPQTPEVRVTLDVPAGVFSTPTTVTPDFNMPGGGLERIAPGSLDIPANVVNVLEY